MIFVVGIFALVALLFIPSIIGIVRNRRMTQEVKRTGVDATASIVRTWDTGVRINDNPQVGMLLLVQPPSGAPFQAEVTHTVSIVQIGMFQPGAKLQVKYDPANPSRVAIISVIAGAATIGAPAAASVMNAKQAEQMMAQF